MKILFDIGGTNTRVSTATADGIGAVSVRPTEADPKKEIALLAELAATLATEPPDALIGCVPGMPKADGTLLRMPNLPAWDGFAFTTELSRNFGGVPVSLEHDASLGALGEARFGAARGAQSVAYFGIGTGVGVGRIEDGRIGAPIEGYEVGHQLLDAAHAVAMDDLVSGRAIAERSGVKPEDAPRILYDELTAVLAAGMYNTILHWKPDVFVLGGSLMNEENGYRLADIVEALASFPPFFESLPPVRLGALGDAANLWGARVLAELSA